MSKLLTRGAVAMALALAFVAAAAVAGTGAEDPSIKDIMAKLHKGPKAPIAVLKTNLGGDAPDWKAVHAAAHEFATLTEGLPKQEAPKGDQAGYEKLAVLYFENSKALDTAAEKEDLAGSKAAFGKLGASCKACHTQHRP